MTIHVKNKVLMDQARLSASTNGGLCHGLTATTVHQSMRQSPRDLTELVI